ncbi:hypothetical protein ACTMTJ_08955 [Phytohabitans sp. LJ34]|uniref:hypothetical protein n=1 Tax=Phytohabitans sp. LJ34 TaxID=3452217 RepID=UPI003F8A6A77
MVVAAMAAATLFPDSDATGRLLAIVLAVGGYAALVADTWAALVTAGLGCLLFDGFLVNRFGDLTWDGTTSMCGFDRFPWWSGWASGGGGSADSRTHRALDEELDQRGRASKQEYEGEARWLTWPWCC